MVGFLRFISPLLHPLGMAWFALLVGGSVCLARRRPLGGAACLLAAASLWLFAQPPVANRLMRTIEAPWTRHTLEQAPAADAVVVLGGGWRRSRHDFVGLDLTPAADRWIVGLELCRLGRARTLVVGGDSRHGVTDGPPDSDGLRDWLSRWGFAGIPLETLGPVATTREEAVKTQDMAAREGWRSILLVTSAYHMRRSVATFEKLGLTVHPVACDFQSLNGSLAGVRWEPFPNLEAFLVSWLWWHEAMSWHAHQLLDHL